MLIDSGKHGKVYLRTSPFKEIYTKHILFNKNWHKSTSHISNLPSPISNLKGGYFTA